MCATSSHLAAALFRSILTSTAAVAILNTIFTMYYSTKLINNLRSHVASSPKNMDVSLIEGAIGRLSAQRTAIAVVIPGIQVFNVVVLALPPLFTYYMSAAWCFACLGEISLNRSITPLKSSDGDEASTAASAQADARSQSSISTASRAT